MAGNQRFQDQLHARRFRPHAAYPVAANALWEAVTGQPEAGTFESAVELLGRVASDQTARRDIAWSAANQLAYVPVFEKLKDGMPVAPENVMAAHENIGRLLRRIVQRDEREPDAMTNYYRAAVVLQGVGTRRRDPSHLILTRDPLDYYDARTQHASDAYYRLSLVMTAGDRFYGYEPDEHRIGHTLWVAEALAALPDPPSEEDQQSRKTRSQFAIHRAGDLILRELASWQPDSTVTPLPDVESAYLDNRGAYLVGLADNKAV